MMKPAAFGVIAATVIAFSDTAPAQAADQSKMLSICDRYAARHLGVSTADIINLSYQGKRVDGTHAVNGSTTRGQSFQCSFNTSGTHVVSWYQSGRSHTSHRASNREMVADCDAYAARRLGLSERDIASITYEGQRTDGSHAVNGSTTSGQTFQCSFNAQGTRVTHWYHSAPQGCPADISQADRYLYPDCS